ncbi:hypothetical protein [Streptomyces sp. adm13(2018)]|uniref:hypothetical protein n=1 Tax=Streptomyces sp. adm13(2018) TaxID=2479007 RepID=UPI002905D532|nr:hypothetical protein [Streptomyces sp. adm13(2018)]
MRDSHRAEAERRWERTVERELRSSGSRADAETLLARGRAALDSMATSAGPPNAGPAEPSPAARPPPSPFSTARTYAAYSAPAPAAIESSAALPRASSVSASARLPELRSSRSTVRSHRRSASARWLSRMCVPLRACRPSRS